MTPKRRFKAIVKSDGIPASLIEHRRQVTCREDLDNLPENVLLTNGERSLFISDPKHFNRHALHRAIMHDLKIQEHVNPRIWRALGSILSCVINVPHSNLAPWVDVDDFLVWLQEAKKEHFKNPRTIYRSKDMLAYGLRLGIPNLEKAAMYLPPNAMKALAKRHIMVGKTIRRCFNLLPSSTHLTMTTPQKFSSYDSRLKGGKENIFRLLLLTIRDGKSMRLQIGLSEDFMHYARLPRQIFKAFFPEHPYNELTKVPLALTANAYPNAPIALAIRFPLLNTNQLALRLIPWEGMEASVGINTMLLSKVGGDRDGDQMSIIIPNQLDASTFELLSSPYYNPQSKLSVTHEHAIGFYHMTKRPKQELQVDLRKDFIQNTLEGFGRQRWAGRFFEHAYRHSTLCSNLPPIQLSHLRYLMLRPDDVSDYPTETALLRSETCRLNYNMLFQAFQSLGVLPNRGCSELAKREQEESLLAGPAYGNGLVAMVQSGRGAIVFSKTAVGSQGGCLNQCHFNLPVLIVNYYSGVDFGDGGFCHDECLTFLQPDPFPPGSIDAFINHEQSIEKPLPLPRWHSLTPYEQARALELVSWGKHLTTRSKRKRLMQRASSIYVTRYHHSKVVEKVAITRLEHWR